MFSPSIYLSFLSNFFIYNANLLGPNSEEGSPTGHNLFVDSKSHLIRAVRIKGMDQVAEGQIRSKDFTEG